MTEREAFQQTFEDGQSTTIEITTVAPGNPVRYPASPDTFDIPVDTWLIYNHCAVTIRVAFDEDAADGATDVGVKIPALTGARIPITTKEYISVDGGDGSLVDCTPFRHEE